MCKIFCNNNKRHKAVKERENANVTANFKSFGDKCESILFRQN